MKYKKFLIILTSVMLLAVSAITVINCSLQAPIFAAKNKNTDFSTIYYLEQTKDTKACDKNGKPQNNQIFRLGKKFIAYSYFMINGKKYYYTDKDYETHQERYIPANTVKIITKYKAKYIWRGVVLTKDSYVYDLTGKRTNHVLIKKGTPHIAYSILKINGKKYYQLDNLNGHRMNKFVRVANTKPGLRGTVDNVSDDPNEASKWGNPDAKQVKWLFKHGAVYFTNEQINQIQTVLWQKIQDYRIQNGYQAYKKSPELDDFAKDNISNSMNGMYKYQEPIDSWFSDKMAPYLPTLAKAGMDSEKGFALPEFYGPNSPYNLDFTLTDRNPDHVAKQIFSALLKNDTTRRSLVGENNDESYGTLALHYFFDGSDSALGVAFIQVSGNSKNWHNYYVAN
ncbi:SLAP domain-containing protein [Lactobacillus sp. ESL0228]|uniref:SLAP domain-containing protein n=1 Tax=Lactobacillus sp. ESL0228 TaxID=2069352 RepID=UPI000EFD8A87|nr:SLAP domain-containing protein [Lactobacillus sp. ESL0228]RMC50944.1 hypothetical protein F5ESL0228_01415 [Lactobacillus sp. ESL0228]